MKTLQVISLLFVLALACSCSSKDDGNMEEPPVAEHIYQLKAIIADKQSLHFTYNHLGQVIHSEEEDALSGNRRYSVQRDYSYNLAKGRIFCRSIYHREGEWGDNNSELDYRDTLFLDKQQRVDSIHRHLIADDHTHQWFALWYKYDDEGQLTDLSMKTKPQGTKTWSKWQAQGTLVWQDGCILKYVPTVGQPSISYTYTNMSNDFYIDARSNIVWADWIPLLQWFGKRPQYLQKSRGENGTLNNFSYQYHEGRIVSETTESIIGNRTETGVLNLVWE